MRRAARLVGLMAAVAGRVGALTVVMAVVAMTEVMLAARRETEVGALGVVVAPVATAGRPAVLECLEAAVRAVAGLARVGVFGAAGETAAVAERVAVRLTPPDEFLST